MKAKITRFLVKRFKDGKLAGQVFPVINKDAADAIAAKWEAEGFVCEITVIEF